MAVISETDLILNPDGSVYHLNLLPEDIADTIITVGDPDRVAQVSQCFDEVEIRKSKREFIVHTGTIGGQRLTVLSTGMGTGNIDVVINELDTLANIDLDTRTPKANLKSLNIIRIGTSGAIQADIPVDSMLVSAAAFGLDSSMHFYKASPTNHADEHLLAAFTSALPAGLGCTPYLVNADNSLLTQLAADITPAITLTAPGFYAAQGRSLRYKPLFADLISTFSDFEHLGKKISNIEMETACIYGLSNLLGHRSISFNIILANRITKQFSKDPGKAVDGYIRQILERITGSK
jgi:uridine phosphorylase